MNKCILRSNVHCVCSVNLLYKIIVGKDTEKKKIIKNKTNRYIRVNINVIA